MRETHIEAHLEKKARLAGWLVFKVVFPGRRGAPDRVLFGTDSRLVWVELKTLVGRESVTQLKMHERLRARGQEVVVLNSIEAVDAWLAVNVP